jgi:glycosyltransferase involved in cell wall biosynthesis
VVVPFCDEEQYLPTFLSSLDAQTRRPDRVFLVDDGSADRSHEIAAEFAAQRQWASVLRRPRRDHGNDRLQHDEGTSDVLVKMDADLLLAPEHFEAVLSAFEEDEQLGMAGTYLWSVGNNGVPRPERHPERHVRGPTRFYRRQCFDAIAPLFVGLGWDGADEVRARARGWRTRSVRLPGQQTLHLRATGAHNGRLRAHARWGRCAYAVGAHPLAAIGGALFRIWSAPPGAGGVAYLWGYLSSCVRDVPRAPEDIRRATRREHVERIRGRIRLQSP